MENRFEEPGSKEGGIVKPEGPKVEKPKEVAGMKTEQEDKPVEGPVEGTGGQEREKPEVKEEKVHEIDSPEAVGVTEKDIVKEKDMRFRMIKGEKNVPVPEVKLDDLEGNKEEEDGNEGEGPRAAYG